MHRLLLSVLPSCTLLVSASIAVTPADQLKVPPGFKVELLREATARDGSWICMTVDPEGRLYISPQGSIPETGFAKDSKWGGLVRATVSEKGVEKWERVPVPVGDAMGLLWAFDSLYVSGVGPEGRGIYRCKDTNGDGLPDTAAMWKKVPGGSGEHGAHALVLGPDKKSLYIIHGNGTGLIDGIAPDSPYRNWGEDDLLPKMKDPVATFFDKIKAPYGYVLRTDENGTKWELMAGGFRNPYDIDFNADGELFTYDSDMEWDRGLPWYRPTRVLHIVPGGEYGFREGSAKWPDWYPDSLPPVCNIGVGCPTGVKFGTAATGWPEQYRKSFFICDWTFGRILAVHMKEKGASYTADHTLKSYTFPKDAEASGDVETFLSGKAMPITDVEFGKDGAMYFTTGGRGTAAGLYRVSRENSRTENAPTDQAQAKPTFQAERPEDFPEDLRAAVKDAGIVADAWRMAKDRNYSPPHEDIKRFQDVISLCAFIRGKNSQFDRFKNLTTALPVSQVKDQANALRLMAAKTLKDDYRDLILGNCYRIAVLGGSNGQLEMLEGLKSVPLDGLSDDLKLLKYRILEVSFARQGRPSEEWVKTGLEKLLAHYPATSADNSAETRWHFNRELCQLLIWLSNPELGELNPGKPVDDSSPVNSMSTGSAAAVPNPGAIIKPGRKGADFQTDLGRQVIEKTLALLEAAPTQEEQIYYALCLRWGYGWTPEQRARYFRWFAEKARTYNGGNSFAKFVDKIRTEALARVPEAERATYNPAKADAAKPGEPLPIRPFVKAWTLADLEPALDALKNRAPDLARGQKLYTAAQCATCHLFKGGGGNVGPDLSAVAQRFGRKDILEAILDPNKVVSDQYAMVTLTVRKNGKEDQVSGLIQEETSGTITLLTDPLTGKSVNFFGHEVLKKEVAKISLMPPALLYTLTAEEVADLLAYLGNTPK